MARSMPLVSASQSARSPPSSSRQRMQRAREMCSIFVQLLSSTITKQIQLETNFLQLYFLLLIQRPRIIVAWYDPGYNITIIDRYPYPYREVSPLRTHQLSSIPPSSFLAYEAFYPNTRLYFALAYLLNQSLSPFLQQLWELMEWPM